MVAYHTHFPCVGSNSAQINESKTFKNMTAKAKVVRLFIHAMCEQWLDMTRYKIFNNICVQLVCGIRCIQVNINSAVLPT